MVNKRVLIISGMMSLFLITLLAITSCGLANEIASTDLSNSMSASENPLGSGKWEAPIPQNKNQCTQLYDIMDAFRVEVDGEVERYDNGFNKCFDENGELREGQSSDGCYPPLVDLTEEIQNSLADFQSGGASYYNNCSIMFETAPVLKEPIFPKSDPVTTQGIQGGGGWGWTGCLTCTYNIDNTEYAFIPLQVDMTQFDGQN